MPTDGTTSSNYLLQMTSSLDPRTLLTPGASLSHSAWASHNSVSHCAMIIRPVQHIGLSVPSYILISLLNEALSTKSCPQSHPVTQQRMHHQTTPGHSYYAD